MNAFEAAERLYGAGQRAWEQGHLIAAEPLLQRAIALAPQHASALHLMGKLRQQNGKAQEALQWQQRSCEVDPSLGWNWFSAGEPLGEEQHYKVLGGFDLFLSVLEKRCQLTPESSEAERV